MIKIEDGVKMPPPRKGYNHHRTKYPFAEMQVGQSIFFEKGDPDGRRAMEAAYKFGQRRGLKFIVRHDEGSVRIWRAS